MSGLPASTIARSGAWVAAGSLAANVASYLFVIVLARASSPAVFGELSALLAVAMIASVPALSLQLLVGREVARRPSPQAARPTLGHAWVIGGATGLLVSALSPVLGAVLHVQVLGLLGVAAMTVPFTAASASVGVPLGRTHMGRFSACLVIMAMAKLFAGLLATSIGMTPTGVLWSLAGMTFVAALIVHSVSGAGSGDELLDDTAWNLRALAVVSSGVSGFLVLTSIDTLLARALLSPDQAGQYAAGTIFTRIAVWGLQFVALTVFPMVAGGASRRLRHASLALVAALGGSGVLLVWVVGPALTRLVAGPPYIEAGQLAWLFAAYGVLLALLHLALTSDIAMGGRSVTVLTWGGSALLAVLAVAWPDLTTASLLGLAILVLAVCNAAGLSRELRPAAGQPSPSTSA